MARLTGDTTISQLNVSAYTIPTDSPESDGTLQWDATTLVLVELTAGGETGIGYSYADVATATLINDKLAGLITGRDALDIPGAWESMRHATRNLGGPGITAMAISAVDSALWDLKARMLGLPLCKLLGQARDAVPIYGSGGFTSYSTEQLQRQLGDWASEGIPRVKMKIGREPERDVERVRVVREVVPPETQIYVDANGAYTAKQALDQAEAFRDLGVFWFEEPVSSDDLAGLHLIRRRAPAGMNIAAGEYGYDLWYFRRMLQAEAVDVMQIDATRAAGITGFLRSAAIAEGFFTPVSAHCAPSLHLHPCLAVAHLFPIEYFHDHVRIEHMLFDGAATADGPVIRPDLSRPGLGLEFKQADAERYKVYP